MTIRSALASLLCLCACVALFGAAGVAGFAAVPVGMSMSSSRSSGFLSPVSMQYGGAAAVGCESMRSRSRSGAGGMYMGKMSKFGIFSPAVVVAKVALGEARLNKVRGKVIALHSQTIQSFCEWVGADPKLRGQLIKKAKTTGDELGMLW